MLGDGIESISFLEWKYFLRDAWPSVKLRGIAGRVPGGGFCVPQRAFGGCRISTAIRRWVGRLALIRPFLRPGWSAAIRISPGDPFSFCGWFCPVSGQNHPQKRSRAASGPETRCTVTKTRTQRDITSVQRARCVPQQQRSRRLRWGAGPVPISNATASEGWAAPPVFDGPSADGHAQRFGESRLRSGAVGRGTRPVRKATHEYSAHLSPRHEAKDPHPQPASGAYSRRSQAALEHAAALQARLGP